jgi:CRP/FNR family transcriptional regulator, cyclic AMP receptor protein
MDSSRIAAIPLFSALAPEQQAQLAEVAGEVTLPAGSVVAAEGDFGYALFAIEEGTAEVRRDDELVGRLGPGDVVGEIAVLSSGRRIATVTATSPVRLITLLNRDVWRLERESPRALEGLRETVRRRTAETVGAWPSTPA